MYVEYEKIVEKTGKQGVFYVVQHCLKNIFLN